MRRVLLWPFKTAFQLMLIMLIMLPIWIMLSTIEWVISGWRMERLFAGQEVAIVSAGEWFGVSDDEFLCLFFKLGTGMPGGKPYGRGADYTDLIAAGFSKDDIPVYNDLFYNIFLWEYFDNHVMGLSPGKRLRFIARPSSWALRAEPETGFPLGYGCYDDTKQIAVRRGRHGYVYDFTYGEPNYTEPQ